MRKVGTVSAAAGFIFLGFWMIVNQRNPYMGEQIFKWWPAIIILLGVELLISFGNRDGGQRTRLSGLVIPVILLFLIVNVFRDVKLHLGSGLNWFRDSKNFNEVVDFLKNIDDRNYRIIEANKALDKDGQNLYINTTNGDINIFKSADEKIKFEAKVYVSKGSSESSYDIKGNKASDGYTIKIDEGYIKNVKLNLYIPDGLNVKFEGNNVRVISDYEFPATSFSVDVNNANLDIKSASSVNFNINNGKVDIKNVPNVAVKSSNAMITVDGNSENMDLQVNNGVISVDNKLCRNVNIQMNSGPVKFKTTDQNVDVQLRLDHGPCVLNREKRLNSGISDTFGTGENKAKISVDNGMITFTN